MIGKIVLAVLVSLLLLCAAIGAVLASYLWLISYYSSHEMRQQRPLEDNAKRPKQQGLSEADLQRLPAIECWKEEEDRTPGCGNAECAVCLEPFQNGQRCRVIPVCSHAFHVDCADAWLSRCSVCPICRRSASFVSDESNNSVSGGAAVALQEEDGRSRPPATAESVVVDVSVA